MKALDLVGKKFERLTVVRKSHRKNDKVMWECLCDCGNITYVSTYYLTSGKIRSCGCFKVDELLKRSKTHNQRHTKLYDVWKTMRQRCNNSKNVSYHNYGGRGISVCEEWENSFQSFYDWSMSNGYSDNLTIDRIDVNGNYCPENCRWTDRQVQANNTRVNHRITYNGETHSMAEWARITGMSYSSLSNRIKTYHWSIERALTEPVRHW